MRTERTRDQQLFINMAAQIVYFAVMSLSSFFLTPYLLSKLGREAYGFVGLANNFSSYAQIMVTALNAMASRFITISVHREDYETANQYFTSLLFANALIAAVLAVPAVLVVAYLDKLLNVPAGIVGDVQLLWGLIFLQFLLGVVTYNLNSATYVHDRLDLEYSRYTISELLRAGMLLLAFRFLPPHVYYLGVTAVVCYVYRTVVSYRFTRRLLPQVRIRRSYFRMARIKELLSAGIWNSILQLSQILLNGLDLLISNLMVSADAMGSVSIAKNLPILINSAFNAISYAFLPQLNISYAKGDMEDIREKLVFSVKLLGMIACIPLACVFFFADTFFDLWSPGQNGELLRIIAVAAMVATPLSYSMAGLLNAFYVTNRLKDEALYQISLSVITLIIVFAALHVVTAERARILIIVGVSSVVTGVGYLTFVPLYVARMMKMKWTTFYVPALKCLPVTAMVMAVGWAARHFIAATGWIGLIAECAVTGVAGLAISFVVLLNSADRRRLLALVRSRTGGAQ